MDQEQVLRWNDEGLLADVVGFETNEVALYVQGTDVTTCLGRQYIDFTGGIAVHACGHNHPEIVAAICAQAQSVLHTSDIMRHAPQLELAHFLRDLFSGIIPGEPWSFQFMNSGSESIDTAAKLALKVTGRSKFIAFEGAFHGRTLFATALSCSKNVHSLAYEPVMSALSKVIHHAPAPRPIRRDENKEPIEERCVEGLRALLEQHGSETAAVFLEAQQGEGGYFPMSPAAAVQIRELTRQYKVLLIADEIQSGFGRTGRWFGFEHLGIVPDIVVFGKAVGGGLPLAGVAAAQSQLARWEAGEHGTTFGGNPVACAAGLAALRVIEREGLVERAAVLGETVKARFCPLIGAHGIADVRGNGLMIGIELRDSAGKPDYTQADRVKNLCRERGLLLLTCGAKMGDPKVDSAVIRLIPPLNIPSDVLNQGIDTLILALTQ